MSVRRNYAPYPRTISHDILVNTAGGVTWDHAAAGHTSGVCDRAYYTGIAGDVGGTLCCGIKDGIPITPGEPFTVSAWCKLPILSGCVASFVVYDQDFNEVAKANTTQNAQWVRASCLSIAGAGDTTLNCRLYVELIHEGDAFDLTVDEILIEKVATLGSYFDGNSPYSLWLGTPNASISANVGDDLTDAVAAIQAKTANLPASPAAVGSAMILTSAYDHAKDDVLVPLAAVDEILTADEAPHVGDYTPSLVDPTTHTAEGFIDVLPDGTLVNCYREGLASEGHTGNSGRVVLRKSTDGGLTWGTPTVVYDDEYDDRNVAGGVIGSRIVVFFRRFNRTDTGWIGDGVGVDAYWLSTYSDDDGATWTGPAAIPAGLLPFSRILHVPGVGYVAPATDNSTWIGYIVSDDGATWTGPVHTTDGALGLQEPTMAYGDGLWVSASRRAVAGGGYTFQTSRDYGLTWNSPVLASDIPPWWVTGGCLLFASGRFLLFGTNRSVTSDSGGDPADWKTWVYESTAARLADDVTDWTLVRSMLHPCATSDVWYYGYAIAVQRVDGVVVCFVTDNASADATLYPEDADLYQFVVSGLPVTPASAFSSSLADAKLDAVLAKTNTLGSLAVTVTSPVAASGTITVYSGDDYASADSRAIDVLVADPTHALGLDGAVVRIKATQATWMATGVVSTTDGYTVTFEATAAQTAAVTRAQRYELEATLANGHVVTLARGSMVTRTNIAAVPEA